MEPQLTHIARSTGYNFGHGADAMVLVAYVPQRGRCALPGAHAKGAHMRTLHMRVVTTLAPSSRAG